MIQWESGSRQGKIENMSEKLRSIHARFSEEQWTELGIEAVRWRLPRGRTVARLALIGLAEVRRENAAGTRSRGGSDDA
jgi:hypothetical protein